VNVLRDLPSVAVFAPSFAYRRYVAKRNVPGFFIRSMNNVYALHYHAEHLPNEDSRVWLGKEADKSGLRKLIVDIRFTDADASSVVENHRILDAQLRLRGLGRVSYRSPDLHAAVLSQAGDGFHQIGTTRMSRNERDGVVDVDCKVHGQKNLYVAGSSVFPTSGQANPTLTALALAARLAGHLAATQRA
jgi:choline dehydrogenase-like flavoprotein